MTVTETMVERALGAYWRKPMSKDGWHKKERTDMRAALTAALSDGVGGWQIIEGGPDETKAPWNGEPVLICTDHNFGSRIHRAIWTDAIHGRGIHGWAVEDRKHGPYPLRGYCNVTHWQPLPAPPPSSPVGGKE